MSPASQIYAKITGPIVMVGFGSIGKGTLPLIERHLDNDKSRVASCAVAQLYDYWRQHGEPPLAMRHVESDRVALNTRALNTPSSTPQPHA